MAGGGTEEEGPAGAASVSDSRRRFMGLGLVAAAGGIAAARAADLPRRVRAPEPRASVSPSCAGCTGCVVVCPTFAIAMSDRGPAVVEERCIRCGYCEAACPVGALRVGREEGQ